MLDLHMPGEWLRCAGRLTKRHVTTPVVVVTAHGEPDTAAQVLAPGAFAYLTTIDGSTLVEAIRAACARTA